AECRMCRIGVITICPHAPCLNGSAKPIAAICVAAPYACSKAIKRVVGDGECFIVVAECCDSNNRPEYFFLKNSHLLVPAENGWLGVLSASRCSAEHMSLAAREHARAFLFANIDIRRDLL